MLYQAIWTIVTDLPFVAPISTTFFENMSHVYGNCITQIELGYSVIIEPKSRTQSKFSNMANYFLSLQFCMTFNVVLAGTITMSNNNVSHDKLKHDFDA